MLNLRPVTVETRCEVDPVALHQLKPIDSVLQDQIVEMTEVGTAVGKRRASV